MSQGVRKISEAVLKDGYAFIVTDKTKDTKYLLPGSLLIDESNLSYLNTDKQWTRFKSTDLFDETTFDPDIIPNNSLLGAKIIDKSITDTKIVPGTIGPHCLKDNSFTGEKFCENSIHGNKLLNNSIFGNKIADNSITNIKLANNSIRSEKLEDGSITNNKLADKTIDASKIKEEGITGEIIAKETILNEHLSDRCIGMHNLQKNCINTENIINGSITASKLADESFDGKLFNKESITDDKIKSVHGIKLIDKSISTSKYEPKSIINSCIADKTISESKLDVDLQKKINSVININPSIEIHDIQHFNTAYVNGNQYIDGNLTVNGNIDCSADITGARVFNPYFCDYAEGYYCEKRLKSGTPICLVADKELYVEELNESNQDLFFGFVTDEYATCLGATPDELKTNKVAVTLAGRIHINLSSLNYRIGDYIEIKDGKLAINRHKTQHSIGRVLQNKKDDDYVLCNITTI